MKMVQTSIIATVVFFLSAGVSFGAEMDDLDITIRMVDSDDLTDMHNELSLPDAASDTAREHAEDEDGRGLTQANEARNKEHEEDVRDEHEDEIDDHDNAHEDDDDINAEHDEAHEEENHEDEHENKDDGGIDGGDPASNI